jgi:hypothetical protein
VQQKGSLFDQARQLGDIGGDPPLLLVPVVCSDV